MTIRVALIEDHPTTILGVKSMLENAKDIEFVKGFPTVTAFFDYVRFVRTGIALHPVDVVLLDLRLADLSMPYDNAKALIDQKTKGISLFIIRISLSYSRRITCRRPWGLRKE